MEAFADEQPSLVLLVHLDSLLYVYGDSRSAMRRLARIANITDELRASRLAAGSPLLPCARAQRACGRPDGDR